MGVGSEIPGEQVHIRLASLDDIDAMRAIEIAAGRLFADIGMAEVAEHPPLDAGVLGGYVEGGRAWVAQVAADVVGYAVADVIDDSGHLEQVSVHPDWGRRGFGRLLIRAVADWTAGLGLPALTLLTFREVPWNRPYYASLGFRTLKDEDLPPGLRALREHEAEFGLDPQARCAMRLEL